MNEEEIESKIIKGEKKILIPTPFYKPHKELLEEVTDHLKSLGFLVNDLTYHEKWPHSLIELIKFRNSPTAIVIRTRSDKIAIHSSKLGKEFKFEAKTLLNENYENMSLEMVPLICHILEAKLDVKCLYCYRDPYKGIDKGFWIKEISPKINVLHIPTKRWNEEELNWFKKIAENYLPKIPILEKEKIKGSGDPYVLIGLDEISRLEHWKICIENFLKEIGQKELF